MPLVQTLNFIAGHPLNNRHRTKALLRFLKWQIGTRMLPGPIVFEWVGGARAVVRRGDTGMTQNVYCGLHDFSDMAYVLHVSTSEDLFVDIGANVGSYTLLACAAKGSRGYCFEPVPSTYRRLCDNLAINNLLSRVVALNIGLSDGEGELAFTASENCTNHVIAHGESAVGSLTVPVRSLDSVLLKESPSLLKLDVEGFELPILDGAKATLGKTSLHSVIMELNGSGARYGFDEHKVINTMNEYGFLPYEYEPFGRELHLLTGRNSTHGNTLFLRNVTMLRERLAHAPRVVVGSLTF
jgi:FkbM family methyltransferase